jgi:ATP-binding cassette subfamily B protein
MLLGPLGSGLHPIVYNYSVKLLIDLFTKNTYITWEQWAVPVLYFLLAQVIMDGGWRAHNFAQLKAMPYVFQAMMDKICKHCFNLPYVYFQNNLAGSIAGKMRGIGDNYYKMHQAIEFQLSKPLLTTIFSGIALAYVNIKIFAFILCFIGVYLPFALKVFTKLAKLEQIKQDSWYYIFGKVADCIANIFTIFAFATKKRETKAIYDYYSKVHNPLCIKYYRYDFITSIVLCLIFWAYLIAVLLFVIHLRNAGEISIGDIAFIMSLTFLFAENSWMTTMEVKDFLEDLAAFRSAFSIMQTPQDCIDKPDAKALQVTKGEILLKDVSFTYKDGSNVFQNLNLHIKPGEKIGIVGHSGAGKSTLIALLLKNFKAMQGDIIIDGQSIYDTSADSLRAQVSLIPQDIMLFHRSIGENIAYAKADATPEEIENAAKMANIHDFIDSLPEKYATIVGERGIKLSGGQRQRIAIARAILKNAPILILDEATSSLDSQTEQEIQNSINIMLDSQNITIIAIAHRLSTIKHMDRIIVMEGGEVVEEGTFAELLAKEEGKFKALWEHQVGGFL